LREALSSTSPTGPVSRSSASSCRSAGLRPTGAPHPTGVAEYAERADL